MTGPEIAAATPWEITQRINGFVDRMKDRRMFTASFITAPVINSGVRSPKNGVTPKELIPEDFGVRGERERIKNMIDKEEEKRRAIRGPQHSSHNNG